MTRGNEYERPVECDKCGVRFDAAETLYDPLCQPDKRESEDA